MKMSWLRTVGSIYLRRQVRRSLGVVEGLENLSHDGGFVLVSNHASYLDHFVLDFLLEAMRDRETWFLTKRESFAHPLLGAWAKAWHGIAVDRDAPSSETIRQVHAALATGSAVCVYPEGTRNTSPETLLEFKPGAFSFAASANVPVVPVALLGTEGVLPKGSSVFRAGRIDVRFGEPISVPSEMLKKTRIETSLKLSRVWIEEALRELRQARARDLVSANGLTERMTQLARTGEFRGKKRRNTLFVVDVLRRNNPIEPEPLKAKARAAGLWGRGQTVAVKQLALALAARRLAKVLRMNPEDSDAHYYLGTVKALQPRRLAEARHHFQSAVQLTSGLDARPLLSLARLEVAHGNTAAASEALDKVELTPGNDAAADKRRAEQVRSLREQLWEAA